VERVTGIGGVFFRAKDPEALRAWYAEHLGVVDPPGGVWRQEEGPTVFAPFSVDTDYFGRPEQAFMVNFRVRDLGPCWHSYAQQGRRSRSRWSTKTASGASAGRSTPRATVSSCGSLRRPRGESARTLPRTLLCANFGEFTFHEIG
jgi:glyoxylase I family protein